MTQVETSLVDIAANTELKAFQEEMLLKLRRLRDQLQEETKESKGSKECSQSSSKDDEIEALRASNAALQKQVEKLSYRIQHLLRAMD